jgi:hypothetical protein
MGTSLKFFTTYKNFTLTQSFFFRNSVGQVPSTAPMLNPPLFSTTSSPLTVMVLHKKLLHLLISNSLTSYNMGKIAIVSCPPILLVFFLIWEDKKLWTRVEISFSPHFSFLHFLSSLKSPTKQNLNVEFL